jgi:DNA-binding response OmpR family regulator
VSPEIRRSLLLVEDNERVADFVARGLRAEGYAVTRARTGPEGLELARAEAFGTIVLDLMLPGLSGQEVLQRLRAEGRLTPILVLSALDAVEDRVEGLRMGADDYLVKPFAFDELVARIDALVRRDRGFQVEPTRLQAGDVVFDRATLEVRRGERRVELTARELALLEFLLCQVGRVVSRARILSNVWGVSEDPLTNVVDVYVRRLRRKLGDDEATLLETVRGHGYRLRDQAADPLDGPRPPMGDGPGR